MIVSELLSGIAAKLGAAGLAKAGVGLTMAAASVTGAGAAGVLPEPAQNAVAVAVEAVTPLDIPGGESGQKKDELAEDQGVEGEVGVDVPVEGEVVEEKDNFGQRVSTDARDDGVDGSVVSQEARQRAEQRRPANAGSQGLDRAAQSKAAPQVPASVPTGRSTSDHHEPASTGSSSTADDHKPAATPSGSPSTADQHKPTDVPGGSSTSEDYKPSDTPAGPGRP
ncbi:MAG: hypothetical protein M3P53_13010 [Actinomycetota bacterium]|nr:hypothetical protein [Actinomycetota bacterium]